MSFAVNSFLEARRVGLSVVRDLEGTETLLDTSEVRVVEVRRADMARIFDLVMDYLEGQPQSLSVAYEPQLPFEQTWYGTDGPLDLGGAGIAFDNSTDPLVLMGFLAVDSDLYLIVLKKASGMISAATLIQNGQPFVHPNASPLPSLLVTFVMHALGAATDALYGLVVKSELGGAVRRNMARKYGLKPGAPIPKEFYRVEIRESQRWEGDFKRGVEATGRAWEVRHRHDVRAHWRVLVHRGSREDMALRRKLERRGYLVSVFEGDLPDDVDQIVRSRGLRVREGEFLAVLTVRVKQHTRGPADAPIVPACWRLRIREPEIPQ